MQYLVSVIDDGTGSPDPATVIDNLGGETVFTDGPFLESKACNRKVEVRPFL